MAHPTHNRAELRRAICSQLQMPFYKRFSEYSTVTTGGSSNAFIDINLVEENNYWNNSWVLFTSGSNQGNFFRVTNFSSGSALVYLDRPAPHLIVQSDNYELLSGFSPAEIHNAINRAIKESFPSFYDTVNDQTLILQEDKKSYDLTGMAFRPWVVTKAWVERSESAIRGIAEGGTATYLQDTKADFSEVKAGWLISIYHGTGSGQLRTVSSVNASAGRIIPTENWTIPPDTTSKYCIWNASEEKMDWYELRSLRFDQKEYPTTMYFTRSYSSVYGMRIRLQYTTQLSLLVTDSSTTVVPSEYIINKALEILYSSRVSDVRVDRQRYAAMVELHANMSEFYRRQNFFRHPDVIIWLEEDPADPISANPNPLDW